MKCLLLFLCLLDSGRILAQEEKVFRSFTPNNFVFYGSIRGDLNQDGRSDVVLIIKDTRKEKVVENRFGEMVDRNRRGLVILFRKENGYKRVLRNETCFSSENEDGGVYFPPELDVSINHNKLFINYNHGRYGSWGYTFRHQNNDFELIGYDRIEQFGPVVNCEVSINFLTKQKKERVNMNENIEEGGEADFKEIWSGIEIDNPIKLSEIDDFEVLYWN